MGIRLKTGILLFILLLAGCGPRIASTTLDLPAEPTATPNLSGLTAEQSATLASLQKVDDYPLYTMTYTGAYRPRSVSFAPENSGTNPAPSPAWACSLFTVLLDQDNLLYGRNFDWQFSPAILLFTDPPDGYASVSMVDIEYLGFDRQSAQDISVLPLEKQSDLLDAPYLPFDGMNEYGLAIGMAAVPAGNVPPDETKEHIGSLGIIRQMLDHARTVDEAVDIIKGYNIDFNGGPPVHYLMSDSTGRAVLVEFYDGEMRIIDNDQPWHAATNFLRSSVDDPAEGRCWRYNKITARLAETNGGIDATAAMQLLANVAQDNTQWSVVYQMSTGGVNVVMGQQYQDAHQFELELAR